MRNITAGTHARTFGESSSLVVAALDALEAIPLYLAELKARLETECLDRHALAKSVAQLVETVERATVDGDNLLVKSARTVDANMSVSIVARQPSGAIAVRTIDVDRDQMTLAGGEDHEHNLLEKLVVAIDALTDHSPRTTAFAAIDAAYRRVAICRSRLSIVKARLDLQTSFLSSVFDGEGTALETRLDGDLDQLSARVLAFDACRSLKARPFSIASGNRKVLESLLHRQASRDA